MINKRFAASTLIVSASTLVLVAVNEGFSPTAYLDSVGKPTIGFGETKNVQIGQKTDVTRSLRQLQDSLDIHAQGMIECIKVPVSQGEYNAYLSFTYNVGVGAFCSSTLNKKLNSGDYAGACKELLKWTTAGGKVVPGLLKRRQEEFQECSQMSKVS